MLKYELKSGNKNDINEIGAGSSKPNVFQLMLSRRSTFDYPEHAEKNNNGPDKIFNKLLDWAAEKCSEGGWESSQMVSGQRFFRALRDALWYIDGTLLVIGLHKNRCIFNEAAEL